MQGDETPLHSFTLSLGKISRPPCPIGVLFDHAPKLEHLTINGSPLELSFVGDKGVYLPLRSAVFERCTLGSYGKGLKGLMKGLEDHALSGFQLNTLVATNCNLSSVQHLKSLLPNCKEVIVSLHEQRRASPL